MLLSKEAIEARRMVQRAARKADPEKVREQNRERQRKYREKNADKVNEYQRQWRAKNPDKVKVYLERYWQKKADELTEKLLAIDSSEDTDNECKTTKA